MKKTEGGGTSCLENEFEYVQQLVVILLLKGILMMLQQRRMEAKLLHHRVLEIEMPSLAGTQFPYFSPLLFPANRNENETS